MTPIPNTFSLETAIDRQPLKIAPSASLLDAIALLVNAPKTVSEKANCLLVVKGDRLLGLLSTKELVAAIAAEVDLEQCKVADLIEKEAIAVPSSELKSLSFVVRLFQHYRLQYLVVIDSQTNAIGLLSAFALCQIVQPKNLLSWKTAAEVMTTQLVRADVRSNILDLAKLMATQQTDYIVIENDEQIVENDERIFTDRDLIESYFQTQNLYSLPNYSQLNPLSCLHSQDSLWTVNQKMRLYQTQSLAVIDRKIENLTRSQLLGVVDRSSLLSILEPQALYETFQAVQLFPQQFSKLQREKIEFLERRNLEIELQAQKYVDRLSRESGRGKAMPCSYGNRESGELENLLKQTEISLQSSEALLNAMFDRSSIGIALCDFNGQLLKTNSTFQTMLGYEEEELQQIHFSELTHQDDRVKSESLFAQLIEEEVNFFEIEKRYYQKNGEVIWVRNRVSKIFNRDSHSPIAIAFIENITNHKQTELVLQKVNEELELRVRERTQELTQSQAALQNQTNLLQTILDSMGDGLLVADTDGQFLIFNPSAKRILRMASIEFSALNGTTDSNLYTSDRITPYPSEKLPLYRAIRGEAIDDAEIFIPNPETLEGVWLSITSRPIKDRTGKILGGVLTFRNTTERNLMEEVLRQREHEFRTLVEHSPDIIARLDSQLRHLYVNPAVEQVTGISRKNIIGKTYRELNFPEDLLALVEESGRSVFETGEEKIVEFNLTTPDGEKYYRLRIVPELDENGKVMSILTISPEITTIKEAETQIKASLKEKEVLLKEIHHRVKNNLYVVASLLELQADSFHDPQVNKVFEDSQHRIYSMALIHEKLYRSENLAQINFGDYLEDLVANLFASYNLQEKQIQLIINAEPIFLNIETATPCGLIVNELVSNTIKHAFSARREGFLRVDFYRDNSADSSKNCDSNLHLIVSDNGVGFPENINFQETTSMGFQVICTLTEQLEGTIELDRTNGTSFLLEFKELHYSKRF
jgi:PAS domain S-box-containing protein